MEEKFQLSYLAVEEDFGGQEVFQVLVICNNVYRTLQSFQVVASSVESFKHCKKLFVVYVIVEFCSLEQARMKYNWINLLLFCYDQKNSCESIFQYIGLHNHLSIGDLVGKDQCGDKCFLKSIECFIVGVEISNGILLGQLD